MRVYASPKDRQPEIRTKVPEEVYDALERYAEAHGLTVYAAARRLIADGVEDYLPITADAGGVGTA